MIGQVLLFASVKRMCCDYHKLNDINIKDAHPIPPINQSIDALGGSKFFFSGLMYRVTTKYPCIQTQQLSELEVVYTNVMS